MNDSVTDPDDRDEPPRAMTLGARLDAAGRDLLARRHTSPVWSRALESLLGRVAALSRQRDRFERLEGWSSPDAVHLTPGSRGPVLVPTGRGSARPAGGQEPRPGSSTRAASPSGAAPSSPGRPLPADLRASVRRATGLGAEQLRVHTDGPADALARQHHADAVTVGRDVHFRDGRYRPDQPEGFGLLAHEASHVWSGPAGADPRRADDLERTARRHELAGRAAAQTATRGPARFDLTPAPWSAGPGPLPTRPERVPEPSRPPGPAAQPAAAPAGRDLAVAAPPPLDVDALRRSLIDELKRQLRTESERGA